MGHSYAHYICIDYVFWVAMADWVVVKERYILWASNFCYRKSLLISTVYHWIFTLITYNPYLVNYKLKKISFKSFLFKYCTINSALEKNCFVRMQTNTQYYPPKCSFVISYPFASLHFCPCVCLLTDTDSPPAPHKNGQKQQYFIWCYRTSSPSYAK